MGKVVMAGGSGFIGRLLSPRFKAAGCEVVILARHNPSCESPARFVKWDGKTMGNWTGELEGADLVLNLAGRSVDCRYNKRNMRDIFDSRTESTQVLGRAIQGAKRPPPLWINSSTATIYRHSEDRPMDERNGEIGTGFSVEVAKKWEKTFFDMNTPFTRKAALRSAIVLGKGGGVLVPFMNLVRLGLGGTQGNGRQMFSWVHEEDLFRIIQFIQSKKWEGVVNAAAPHPLPNKEIMKIFREVLKVPWGLPAPEWLLVLGAWAIRTETELLLKSRWVVPGRLLQEGFKFNYPVFPAALSSLL